MRQAVLRALVLVVSVVLAVGVLASPRESKGGNVVKKIVRKIKALGDFITIPGV